MSFEFENIYVDDNCVSKLTYPTLLYKIFKLGLLENSFYKMSVSCEIKIKLIHLCILNQGSRVKNELIL